ncbi:MAG: hypothetical protein WA996_15405 [Candidatus Promineifilaceae bacterium]
MNTYGFVRLFMGAFLSQNIISLIFGITTVVTSLIALHYMRLEHRREVEEVIDGGRKVSLFLSREAMIKYLMEMYDKDAAVMSSGPSVCAAPISLQTCARRS